MKNPKSIQVNGKEIVIVQQQAEDYISLTDIARYKNANEPKDVVKNWMRSKSTLEFLGLWEKLNNPHFKGVDFDPLLFEAGSNGFVLSPGRWIESTNAIGIISRAGKNGGTFAHRDIAFEFASWVSPEFKLYLVVEFQRVKQQEARPNDEQWSLHRTLAKVNYVLQTEAIKDHLLPPEITQWERNMVYASEADVLNVALFGQTALAWRRANPHSKGNMRDEATVEQLVVLANLESLNATLIHEGLPQSERLFYLNKIAIQQLKVFIADKTIPKLQA